MTELEELEQRWDDRCHKQVKDWNTAADSWERKYRRGGARQARSEQRIRDTVEFLSAEGAILPMYRVLDIGCGPGRFVAEFSRRCASVTGVDISDKMCAYGKEYCAEQGLKNTSFLCADFSRTPIEELDLAGKYDLAFSSITPAIRGLTGLNNLIAASRKWCFNASFIREENDLLNQIRTDVFGLEPHVGRGMHDEWFFLLFRILWLRGYDPILRYYDQVKRINQIIDDDIVRVYCEHALGSESSSPEEEKKIRRYLEEHADKSGTVTEYSRYRTAWLLWQVDER